jgi:hypothetical protein
MQYNKKGKGKAQHNARGFNNLKAGSLISFCFEYDSTKDEVADDPLFILVNDKVNAQFRQMNQFKHLTTKLVTYQKIGSKLENAYQSNLLVTIESEKIHKGVE